MTTLIEKTKDPVKAEDLARLVQVIGTALPEEYRSHILKHNGGTPKPSSFAYYTKQGHPKNSSVAWFFNIGDAPYENLFRHLETFAGRIPPNLLPIARDPGGGLILLGLRGPAHGKIFYWDQRNEVEEGSVPDMSNIYPVADSFERFLAGLEEP
jgi:hypothetical protein